MKKTSKFKQHKYIDVETGEEIIMNESIESVNTSDRDFEKVWINTLLSGLDELTNQKMKVAFYILSHAKRNNEFYGRQEDIAKATKVSEKTVWEAIKLLLKNDILRRKHRSIYYINPDCMWYGNSKGRIYAVKQYRSIDQEDVEPTIEEQRQDLIKAMAKLQKQLDALDALDDKKTSPTNQEEEV